MANPDRTKQMLTTPELAAILERMTYKPGWTFVVYDGRWEGQHLVVRTEVEDTYHPGQTVTLDVHSPLPPQHTSEQFMEWLAWRLGRIENHEMREFLKFDGSPVYDPHGPYADRDQ